MAAQSPKQMAMKKEEKTPAGSFDSIFANLGKCKVVREPHLAEMVIGLKEPNNYNVYSAETEGAMTQALRITEESNTIVNQFFDGSAKLYGMQMWMSSAGGGVQGRPYLRFVHPAAICTCKNPDVIITDTSNNNRMVARIHDNTNRCCPFSCNVSVCDANDSPMFTVTACMCSCFSDVVFTVRDERSRSQPGTVAGTITLKFRCCTCTDEQLWLLDLPDIESKDRAILMMLGAYLDTSYNSKSPQKARDDSLVGQMNRRQVYT